MKHKWVESLEWGIAYTLNYLIKGGFCVLTMSVPLLVAVLA